jgi:hypothetical protein
MCASFALASDTAFSALSNSSLGGFAQLEIKRINPKQTIREKTLKNNLLLILTSYFENLFGSNI